MDSEFPMRRWAVVALALVAAVAIGTFAYQAGVSQGIALQPPPVVSAPAAPGGAQAAPAPAPYPYYRYRFGPRFGFFGFIGPLFGFILFIWVMRAIFWGLFGFGCGWGWRRRWRYHDGYNDPYDGPSRFDDWHRRAHDRMRDDRGPTPTTNV